jgi:hypothetical protein
MADSADRFEFRVWGNDLAPFRAVLDSRGQRGEDRTSGETYLASRTNPRLNAKIRADLLDVKVLVEERDRLQRWHLEMKAMMPCALADLAKVPDLMRALEREASRATFDTESLKQILSRADSGFAVLDIQKRRFGYTFGGCIAEYAEVSWNGGGDSTISIETVDANALLAAARDLGIYSRENVSYPSRVVRAVDAQK